MKKDKLESPSIIISRQELLQQTFSRVPRPMRIADLLQEVASEIVIDQSTQRHTYKLEVIMRYVVDQAMLGNLWCIQFLAERMEGKPKQFIESRTTTGDIRDLTTEELMAAYRESPDAEADFEARIEREVEMRVQARLMALQAPGVLESPPSQPVVAESPLRAETKRPVRRGLDPLVAAKHRAESRRPGKSKKPK